jgi:hypothetical protein
VILLRYREVRGRYVTLVERKRLGNLFKLKNEIREEFYKIIDIVEAG